MSATLFCTLAIAAGVTFGWQPDSGGQPGDVEYIVQVTPDAVDHLKRHQDLTSTIPTELRGHVSRIVVRIGNDRPPRKTPDSLQAYTSRKSPSDPPYVARRGGTSSAFGELARQGIQQMSNRAQDAVGDFAEKFEAPGLQNTVRDAGNDLIRRAQETATGPTTSRSNTKLDWKAAGPGLPSTSRTAANGNTGMASPAFGPTVDPSLGNRLRMDGNPIRMANAEDQNGMTAPSLPADPNDAASLQNRATQNGRPETGSTASTFGFDPIGQSQNGTSRSVTPGPFQSPSGGRAVSNSVRQPSDWEKYFKVAEVKNEEYFDRFGDPMNTELIKQQIRQAQMAQLKAEQSKLQSATAGSDRFGNGSGLAGLDPDGRRTTASAGMTPTAAGSGAFGGFPNSRDPQSLREMQSRRSDSVNAGEIAPGTDRTAAGFGRSTVLPETFARGEETRFDQRGLPTRGDPNLDSRSAFSRQNLASDTARAGLQAEAPYSRVARYDRRDTAYPAASRRDDDTRADLLDFEERELERRYRERQELNRLEEDRRNRDRISNSRLAANRGDLIESPSDRVLGDDTSEATTRPAIVHSTSPLINGILLVSAIGNCYLFLWLRNMRTRYRELVASKASRGVASGD